MNRGRPAFEKPSTNETWLSDIGWVQRNRLWLHHMNGVAFYAFNDPVFDAILAAAKALTLANPNLPWDVTVCIAVMEAITAHKDLATPLETFPLMQLLSTRVHFTDFVWNVGSQIENPDILAAAQASGVFLLHGQSTAPMRDDHRRVAHEAFTKEANAVKVAARYRYSKGTSAFRSPRSTSFPSDNIRSQQANVTHTISTSSHAKSGGSKDTTGNNRHSKGSGSGARQHDHALHESEGDGTQIRRG
eukprot:6029332-Prymnesium_polylepis.1